MPRIRTRRINPVGSGTNPCHSSHRSGIFANTLVSQYKLANPRLNPSASPRNAEYVASVTISGCTLIFEMNQPFNAPQAVPVATAASAAAHIGHFPS